MSVRLKLEKTLTVLLLVAAFLLVSFSEVRNTRSDPRATLLVSDSIITEGSLRLDRYGERLLKSYGYVIYKRNGHYYYYFPIGTSIISIPFVALAKGWGLDVVQSEGAIQIIIASFAAVFTLAFLVKLARLFFPPMNAILVSAVFWFGSSFVSTMGTALWSHNFAALFALLAIYSSVKVIKSGGDCWSAIVAGCLFLAYLCRPTMSLLSPFILPFVFTHNRVAAVKSAALLGVMLSVFVGFSVAEFNQVLPDYYLPNRLAGGNFVDALYGNLLSPARGLLVYSPFIAVSWLCFFGVERPFGLKKSWLLVGAAWPITHLICISRFAHWWAGWTYGARFMTDIIPGLFLLALRTWPVNFSGFKNKVVVMALVVSSLIAVYFNSWQGLFNQYSTIQWNSEPNIDAYPEYLFDWRYPPFAYNDKLHQDRIMEFKNGTVCFDSKGVEFVGWSVPEAHFRWSTDTYPYIRFDKVNLSGSRKNLFLRYSLLDRQRVKISLNGTVLADFSGTGPGTISLTLPPALLKEKSNTLAFHLPDSHKPGNGDPRTLGIAFYYLRVM